jgi:hypothetical protein
MGLAELDWKSKTHRLNIQTSTVLPSSPSTTTPPIGASATPFSPSAELSVNLAKIATHFEKQSLDSSRKDQLQNPSWARLSTQAQGTILRAMTTNSEDAATDPTPEFQEFLSQRSASTAFIYLLEYFEANERSRYVSINHGLTTALWAGVIRAPRVGSPENLSPFFLPRRNTSDTSGLPNLIGQHMKQIEGQGLDLSEIKLATKQKICLPIDVHDFLHQLLNYHLLLKFLFGEKALLYLRFQKVVSHISRHEAEYEDLHKAQPELFAALLSLFDRRIQAFLEDCSKIHDVSKIDVSVLGFDSVLRDIEDGTFHASLPSAIRTALPKPTIDKSINPIDPRHPKEKRKIQGDVDPNKKQKERGDPQINDSVYPAWCLAEGEDYVKTFVKDLDRSKLPKVDICLNFHIRGSCHSACPRVASHKAATTFDNATKAAVTTYINQVRAQVQARQRG